jgi:hypothetical protein
MTGRLERYLLARLRRTAARRAIDDAIARDLLAEVDDEGSKDSGSAAGFATFVDDDDDAGQRAPARRRRLGSRLTDAPASEIVRILARDGILADPAKVRGGRGKSGDRRRPVGADKEGHPWEAASVADIVRAVRRSAAPPPVEEIAIVLLLTDGIAQSGLSEDEVLAVLRRPGPMVSIMCPVEGFEKRVLSMLKDGLLAPHPITTANGHSIVGSIIAWRSVDAKPHRAIIFAGDSAKEGKSLNFAAQIGTAAASGFPVLAVAEADEDIVEAIRLGADLDLRCGPLTPGLIGRCLEEVLGPLPPHLDLAVLSRDCGLLSVHDLPVAIRPGSDPHRAIAVLVKLGAMKRRQPRGEEGTGSAWSGWSSKGSRGRNGAAQSGSEVVKPATAEQLAADAFLPRVETLHGYGPAQDWALALKADLLLWQEGQLDWSAMSTKLLLSGAPGTGKTSWARALCNSLQVPLVATSVSTWLEPSYLGDVVKRMKLSFREASTQAPCILFIDEIDGVGRRRQDGPHADYWNTVVNTALELLDGAVRSSGIIVVGATNDPGMIDPALLRSGRLETHIRIPAPDVDALVGILRHHLGPDVAGLIATKPTAALEALPELDRRPSGGAPATAAAHTSARAGADEHRDVPHDDRSLDASRRRAR